MRSVRQRFSLLTNINCLLQIYECQHKSPQNLFSLASQCPVHTPVYMWGCKDLDPVLQVIAPCMHGCYGYRGSIYTWRCYESVHVPRENRPRRKKIVSIQILQAAPAHIDHQLIRSGLHMSSRLSINLKRLSAGRMIDVVPMDAH